MTVLLDDPAVEVRLVLADALARSEQAPQHIIMTLAADTEPVALLVAEHSPVILDSELVDMVAMRGETMQIAIAQPAVPVARRLRRDRRGRRPPTPAAR